MNKLKLVVTIALKNKPVYKQHHEEGVLEQGLHFLTKPSPPQAMLRKVREVIDGERAGS